MTVLGIIIGIFLIVGGLIGIVSAFRRMESYNSKESSTGFGLFFVGGISAILGIWLTIGSLVLQAIVYIVHIIKG